MLSAALSALVLGAGPATLTLAAPPGAVDFGVVLAAAGDVNGDGRGDLVVGMPRYTGAHPEEGWVGLYLGADLGVAATPTWTTTGGQPYAHLGAAVAGVGDVDGDGLADLAAGAPGFSRGAAAEGILYVWLGAEAAFGEPWSVEGVAPGARLGAAVAPAGDVDGDGLGDLLVGLPGLGPGGRVQLHLGDDAGPVPFAAWTRDGAAGDALGALVRPALDVDGDGLSDVLVETSSATWLFLGAPVIGQEPFASLDPNTTALGDVDASGTVALAPGLVPAGDVNGDGYADALALDLPGGRVAVLAGSPTGLREAPIRAGDCACEPGGPRVVVAAGDLDGDGMGDIAIGAPASGVITLWRGAWSGLAATPDLELAGYPHVAPAGDVDGDGLVDLLVGSPATIIDGVEDVGALALLRGSRGALGEPGLVAVGEQAGAAFTSDLAPAGDVDGDGYEDVLVASDRWDEAPHADAGRVDLLWGAPTGLLGAGSHRGAWTARGAASADGYDDRLGIGLAGLGDVDGDGLMDFAIGRHGAIADGQVDLWLGDPVVPRHAWRRRGPDWWDRVAQVYALGDLDGDGLADLAINAVTVDRALAAIFLGARDADPVPLVIAAGLPRTTLHAGAGDVDGDGFADVLGSDRTDAANTGRVDLVLGAPGTTLGPITWSAAGHPPTPGERFGTSVGGVGDLDADGYADVLVRADRASRVAPRGGRIHLYQGGPEGLPATPAWTYDGTIPDEAIGRGPLPLGDLDGDGFGDLAIGHDADVDPGDHRARVFFGNRGLGFAPASRPAIHARGLARYGPLPPGGTSDASDGAFFRGFGRSPFGPMRVALEVEVKPWDAAFDGRGLVRSDFVDVDRAARALHVAVTGLAPGGAWRWRARLRFDPAQAPPQGWTHWTWGGAPGHASRVHLRTRDNRSPEVDDHTFAGVDAIGVARFAPGLLAYARDEDPRDTLIASVVDEPSAGTLELHPDGTFFYVPAAGFVGRDRFRWRATDPHGASAIGTITLEVEPGGTCEGTTLASCGRGRVMAILDTSDGPRAIRCWRELVDGEPRLQCATDRDGALALSQATCEAP
ncbi:MAG: FG-GAP repeat protein [Deltaproteobacteria bacterium]|nr:FG-GAP repeat protein [Deltaproteobacteria bacterium]